MFIYNSLFGSEDQLPSESTSESTFLGRAIGYVRGEASVAEIVGAALNPGKEVIQEAQGRLTLMASNDPSAVGLIKNGIEILRTYSQLGKLRGSFLSGFEPFLEDESTEKYLENLLTALFVTFGEKVLEEKGEEAFANAGELLSEVINHLFTEITDCLDAVKDGDEEEARVQADALVSRLLNELLDNSGLYTLVKLGLKTGFSYTYREQIVAPLTTIFSHYREVSLKADEIKERPLYEELKGSQTSQFVDETVAAEVARYQTDVLRSIPHINDLTPELKVTLSQAAETVMTTQFEKQKHFIEDFKAVIFGSFLDLTNEEISLDKQTQKVIGQYLETLQQDFADVKMKMLDLRDFYNTSDLDIADHQNAFVSEILSRRLEVLRDERNKIIKNLERAHGKSQEKLGKYVGYQGAAVREEIEVADGFEAKKDAALRYEYELPTETEAYLEVLSVEEGFQKRLDEIEHDIDDAENKRAQLSDRTSHEMRLHCLKTIFDEEKDWSLEYRASYNDSRKLRALHQSLILYPCAEKLISNFGRDRLVVEFSPELFGNVDSLLHGRALSLAEALVDLEEDLNFYQDDHADSAEGAKEFIRRLHPDHGKSILTALNEFVEQAFREFHVDRPNSPLISGVIEALKEMNLVEGTTDSSGTTFMESAAKDAAAVVVSVLMRNIKGKRLEDKFVSLTQMILSQLDSAWHEGDLAPAIERVIDQLFPPVRVEAVLYDVLPRVAVGQVSYSDFRAPLMNQIVPLVQAQLEDICRSRNTLRARGEEATDFLDHLDDRLSGMISEQVNALLAQLSVSSAPESKVAAILMNLKSEDLNLERMGRDLASVAAAIVLSQIEGETLDQKLISLSQIILSRLDGSWTGRSFVPVIQQIFDELVPAESMQNLLSEILPPVAAGHISYADIRTSLMDQIVPLVDEKLGEVYEARRFFLKRGQAARRYLGDIGARYILDHIDNQIDDQVARIPEDDESLVMGIARTLKNLESPGLKLDSFLKYFAPILVQFILEKANGATFDAKMVSLARMAFGRLDGAWTDRNFTEAVAAIIDDLLPPEEVENLLQTMLPKSAAEFVSYETLREPLMELIVPLVEEKLLEVHTALDGLHTRGVAARTYINGIEGGHLLMALDGQIDEQLNNLPEDDESLVMGIAKAVNDLESPGLKLETLIKDLIPVLLQVVLEEVEGVTLQAKIETLTAAVLPIIDRATREAYTVRGDADRCRAVTTQLIENLLNNHVSDEGLNGILDLLPPSIRDFIDNAVVRQQLVEALTPFVQPHLIELGSKGGAARTRAAAARVYLQGLAGEKSQGLTRYLDMVVNSALEIFENPADNMPMFFNLIRNFAPIVAQISLENADGVTFDDKVSSILSSILRRLEAAVQRDEDQEVVIADLSHEIIDILFPREGVEAMFAELLPPVAAGSINYDWLHEQMSPVFQGLLVPYFDTIKATFESMRAEGPSEENRDLSDRLERLIIGFALPALQAQAIEHPAMPEDPDLVNLLPYLIQQGALWLAADELADGETYSRSTAQLAVQGVLKALVDGMPHLFENNTFIGKAVAKGADSLTAYLRGELELVEHDNFPQHLADQILHLAFVRGADSLPVAPGLRQDLWNTLAERLTAEIQDRLAPLEDLAERKRFILRTLLENLGDDADIAAIEEERLAEEIKSAAARLTRREISNAIPRWLKFLLWPLKILFFPLVWFACWMIERKAKDIANKVVEACGRDDFNQFLHTLILEEMTLLNNETFEGIEEELDDQRFQQKVRSIFREMRLINRPMGWVASKFVSVDQIPYVNDVVIDIIT